MEAGREQLQLIPAPRDIMTLPEGQGGIQYELRVMERALAGTGLCMKEESTVFPHPCGHAILCKH